MKISGASPISFGDYYKSMFKKTYDYCSTQFPIFDGKLEAISQEYIKEDDLHKDPDGGKGREKDFHCTVLYGLQERDLSSVKNLVTKINQFEVTLGQISLFQNEECDVVKIEVESRDLNGLHYLLKNSIPNDDVHKEFSPHVTLAYVSKSKSAGIMSRIPVDYFVGQTIKVTSIQFSHKNGSKTEIPLFLFSYDMGTPMKFGGIN